MGKSYAGITDGHKNSLVFSSLRFNDELSRPVHRFHRIDAVYHEVHHELLQLHAIPRDWGKIWREFCPD